VHELTLIRRIAGFAAAALLFAACGNAGTGSTAAPTAAALSTAQATGGATAEPSEDAEDYEVELADNDKLGEFLSGEDGRTLYTFTPDTTSASNCNGDCAANWPPFTLDAGETVEAGDGVTGTFATIARQDGTMQVTYAGHPLYYFAGDNAAGDVNGQGLNDKWYVVGADGNPVMSSGSSGGKGNY
jgi:predicted lipoprotein with Yx(FWY)xxD motif